MKEATYTINEITLRSVTIRIDEEASRICRSTCFTGFTLKDAIRQANKRLRVFGYEIKE